MNSTPWMMKESRLAQRPTAMADSPLAGLNPYEPPRVACEPVCVFRTNPGAGELQAQRVHRGFFRRMVRFYGEYEGLIDWNAAGPVETVSIDARVAESKLYLGPHVVMPRFDIPVDAGRPATLTIEVRTAFLFFVSAFRILLDDRTLYAEGEWADSPSPVKPK